MWDDARFACSDLESLSIRQKAVEDTVHGYSLLVTVQYRCGPYNYSIPEILSLPPPRVK